MLQEIVSKVIRKTHTFPLRIMGESKHLACPYELTSDSLELSFLKDDIRVAHFQVTSEEPTPVFRRHFLYSKVSGDTKRHLVTASGYLFEGKVDVYSWKARDFSKQISAEERETINTLSLVEFLHVSGDKKNKTAGFASTVALHMKRIAGLNVDGLSLEESMQFYTTLTNHVPNS